LLPADRAPGDCRLAAAIGEAVNWTIHKVSDLVDALLDAGKKVADILAAAVTKGMEQLKKYVEAVLRAGGAISEVLLWAAGQVAATIEAVLAVVGQTVTVLKAVFGALIAAGRKVVQILVALAGRAVSALRTALEALLTMGISLASLAKDIVTGVAQAFRRGFFEGLVALGKAPLQLLKAAAEMSVSVLLLAFAVVLEMCGGYRPLTKQELAEAKKVFGSAIELDRVKLGFADLPGDVIRYLNIEIPRAFTTMYLLNFGPGARVDMQTIIHEIAHVWQGVQEGPLYMTRALEAQIGAGVESLFHTGKYDDSAAYTVTAAALAANGGGLRKFNPEQQASIVEFFWVRAFSDLVVPGGFPGDDRRAQGLTLEALLPYAQKVNPALRAPARAAAAKRKVVPATAASAKPVSSLVYI